MHRRSQTCTELTLTCIPNPQERSRLCEFFRSASAATQAFAEASEQLAQGTFRPVRGRSLVAELAPAGDYYLAEKYHQQYLQRGGRFGMGQSAEKGATDKIRCYG